MGQGRRLQPPAEIAVQLCQRQAPGPDFHQRRLQRSPEVRHGEILLLRLNRELRKLVLKRLAAVAERVIPAMGRGRI